MPQKCCDPDQLSQFLKIIADKNRLCILYLLRERELCVCEIWRELDLPQNLTSHHLKTLTRVGLLKARKDGRWIRYALDKSALKLCVAFLKDFS